MARTCANCGSEFRDSSVYFCLNCGKALVPESEVPTLPNARSSKPSRKTRLRSKEESLETENRKLKEEIEELKKTSAVLFGTKEEDLKKRVARILKVSGYESDIFGSVDRTYEKDDGSRAYYSTNVSGFLGNFSLYTSPAKYDDEDEVVAYVGEYPAVTDFEKELADLRVLLHECSEAGLPCTFVIATNEDLSDHKKLLTKHFNQIKTFVRRSARSSYQLQIWDRAALAELEYDLKIKVRPNTAAKPRPKKR